MYITKENGINLYNNLLELSNDQLFNEKYSNRLPHPADILNEKLKSLSQKLKLMLNHENDGSGDDKATSISNYILDVDRFYDSLFLIIKCLTMPQGEENKDVIIWLRSIKSQIYNDFVGPTDQKHKLFRDISNKIKHDHVGISFVAIENQKNVTINGFYILSTVGDEDQRGPDPNIHEQYHGIQTAFSYNHFILNSIGCIFYYLYHLNKLLFKKQSKTKNKQDHAYEIASICKNISHDFFPDEYRKPYSLIKEEKDGKILLTHPYRYKGNKKDFGELKVSAYIEVNERTNKARKILPYFQNKKNK